MNPTDRDHDLAQAIRQRNVRAIISLFFSENPKLKVRPGFTTETELWDFKFTAPAPGAGTALEWSELAKDVLAFHNNRGGIILFGITDDFQVVRTKPQLDSKLVNDRLRKYLGDQIWVEYHRIGIESDQSHIGVLLIPPRGPLLKRFQKNSAEKNGKPIFCKNETALRSGDSTRIFRGAEADAQEARTMAPEFGEIYAIDEPHFRILSPEYENFTLREAPCAEVEKGLADPRTCIVQIIGVGGAGKTALATWAVIKAYETEQFKFIVSTTAKDRELTSAGIQSLAPKLTSYENLLNSVLDVLEFPELKTEDIAKREQQVKELLTDSNGLLYVDNLETVDDPRIIEFLDNLPVGVRAIVTSRRDTIRFSVFPVNLGAFSEAEAFKFVRSFEDTPGLGFVGDLQEEDVERIREACDGLPLAIRWTLARSGSAAEALKTADAITGYGRTGEELLEFSFRRIFDSLSKDEKALLEVLSLFHQPQPTEVLYVGSGIAQLKMHDVLSALLNDALIQRFFDEQRNDYTYLLLPLTRTFVYTQVKASGRREDEIRKKLVSYFDAKDVEDPNERVVVRELRQGRSDSESGLIDLAMAAKRRRDYQNARELLEQALNRNPGNYDAAHKLGELFRHQLRNTSDALRCYEQAAANAPSSGRIRAKIFREWGLILRESGGIDAEDQAIEKLKEAVRCAPNDHFAVYALAQCLERRGAYIQAIPLLERIQDHNSEKTRALARPMLLDCYEKQGDMIAAATLRSKMK